MIILICCLKTKSRGNEEPFQIVVYKRREGALGEDLCAVDNRGYIEGELVVLYSSCNHFVHALCHETKEFPAPLCPVCSNRI